MNNLIIVESPTKARTLSRFLGTGEYKVEATMGHIRDLPIKKLGVNVKSNFEPEYVVSEGKEEIIEKIIKAAKSANNIYLATDPDREGEAISWHVKEILTRPQVLGNRKFKQPVALKKKVVISRITFHEITKSAVEEALKHAGEVNTNLVEAQTSRRILDRLVGYKLSPLLWLKVRRGLSAGRVQSVVVRIIVEREAEIEKFVPIEYWEISALLKKLVGADLPESAEFLAKLAKKNGEKVEIHNQKEADDIVNELNDAGYEVYSIDKKEIRRNPPAPFTTSTLQQTAAGRLGWTSKKTMNIAQNLYEQGLITYHRTDSTNLAAEAVAVVRSFIQNNFGKEYLPGAPKIYVTKSKSAQEAHEAIRPTDVGREKVDESTTDLEKLYNLIWKRYVACQMEQSVSEVTTLTTQAEGKLNLYQLETKGALEKFDGWKKVYGKVEEIDEDGNKIETIPPLSAGDDLKLLEIKPDQKFTQPPPRYTEASLIKTLEELGIGRPSTYAPTISTIQDRNYVERRERSLVPTPLGIAVNEFLMEYFKDILDYQFTANMEDDLDQIAEGKKQRVPVLKEFYIPFEQKLDGVKKIAQRVAIEVEATGESCPECKEGSVVIRVGKFGRFLSCSRFPECRYRAPYIKVVEGIKCPRCGGDIVYKKTKTGKGFYGCSNYPKCDFASWHKPSIDKPSEAKGEKK